MREWLAKLLVAATAVAVTMLAAAFSLAQNGWDGRREAAAPDRQAAVPGPVEAGRLVYQRHGCARCHAIGGQGNPRSPLDGVGTRRSAAEIRDWTVAAPSVSQRLAPGIAAFKRRYADLSEAELAALVAYLESLREPPKGG